MRSLVFGFALFLSACATGTQETPAPADMVLSPGVAWVAEGKGWADEAEAVYAEATSYILDTSRTRPEGSWAVVLDLDETVINNVAYQIGRERLGETYTAESWHEWTQEKSATLIPGVETFLTAVRKAGGHVAFVTNRSDSEQLATEQNLAELGLTRHDDFRILMTRARPKGESSKDSRYDLVPALLAAQGYESVETIAYLGDNKGDKPAAPGSWRFFCIDQGAMYGDPCAAVPGPGQ